LLCSASKRAENEAQNSKINIESNNQNKRRSFDHGEPKNLPNEVLNNNNNNNNNKNDASRKSSFNELTVNPVNYNNRIATQDVIVSFNYFSYQIK
jgi:hypothetical protein